jgi:DNA-binding NtrC family response regulator
MATVLIVEDDPAHREALHDLVAGEGVETRLAGCVGEAKQSIEAAPVDLVLCDLILPDGRALDLLPSLEDHPETDFVLVTGQATLDSAVEAFRGGAVDYLTKPIDVSRLRAILARLKRAHRLRTQVGRLQDELLQMGHFARLIGASKAMHVVYDQIRKVAPTRSTVLITGETGTGKELVAGTLHDRSPRSAGPFVAVNCAAISPTLIESELFGHEKGSFTGASRRHEGFFERARNGTLFLDEITEMPLELQAKLLRTLESREVQRVGGQEPVAVDVRLVAATNRDPQQSVADGRLREDLLYRLLVFPIHVPPLRERGDDVTLLANHFLERLNAEGDARKEFSKEARERLRLHHWPGNVRELEHAIERAFIEAAAGDIGVDCLPFVEATQTQGSDETLPIRVGCSLAEAERIVTLATLDRFREKKKTAEVLGISLKTLYTRLKGYGARSAS